MATMEASDVAEDVMEESRSDSPVLIEIHGKFYEVESVSFDELNDTVVITAGEEAA